MKKIYRSSTDRKILGICAGIGEYFEVDPTLVRLGLVVATLAGGSGIMAYIIAALLIPEAPSTMPEDREN